MAYFVFFLLLFSAIWLGRKRAAFFKIQKKDIVSAILLKTIGSVAFVSIFTYYYGDNSLDGDAYLFMKDSKIINEVAFETPINFLKLLTGIGKVDPEIMAPVLDKTNIWTTGENGDIINDNLLFIRFNAIIHFFSFNSPYIHALCCTLLSLIGLLFVFKAFGAMVTKKRLFLFSLVGFPNILFWSSGITKGSLMVFAFGLFVYGLSKLHMKRLSIIISLTIASFILFVNKPYAGLILVAASALFLFGYWFRKKTIGILFFLIIWFGGFIIVCLGPSKINLVEKISYKQKDLINLGKGGIFFTTDSSFCAFSFEYVQNFKVSKDSIEVLRKTMGDYKLFGIPAFHAFKISSSSKKYAKYLVQPPSNSFIETQRINYNFKNLIVSTPMAISNTFLRPFPTDPGSSLKILSFLSNLLILGLIFISLNKRRQLNDHEKYWLVYLALSALSIALIIGWTIPILGAIVRYKMIVDLLLICITFTLWGKRKDTSI